MMIFASFLHAKPPAFPKYVQNKDPKADTTEQSQQTLNAMHEQE